MFESGVNQFERYEIHNFLFLRVKVDKSRKYSSQGDVVEISIVFQKLNRWIICNFDSQWLLKL